MKLMDKPFLKLIPLHQLLFQQNILRRSFRFLNHLLVPVEQISLYNSDGNISPNICRWFRVQILNKI